MAEAYCCPFCNTLFPPNQAQASPRGPCCPRCGEPLPALAQPALSAIQTATSAPALGDAAVQKRRSRRSNLIVGAIVLFVMAVMAAVGLTLALWTKNERRRNDYKSPPGEWAGMGYLPVECHLVFKLQVSQLQEEYEARKLLAEPRPTYVDIALTDLEKLSGLKLEMIDYAILGVVLQPFQANLVVVTNKPYDPAQLVKNLKAQEMGEHHAMPVYSFNSGLGPARLWCPEQHVFVVAFGEFKKGSHEEFPFPPREGLRGQRPEVQYALSQRQKDSFVWVAGDGDWKSMPYLIVWQLLQPKKMPANAAASDLDKLLKIKTFVLSLDRDLVLHGALFAGDKEMTLWLEKYLTSLSTEAVKVKVVVPPPDVLSGPPAFWVRVQANFTAEQLRKMLTELAAKKGK
jgi:hypothetical protein